MRYCKLILTVLWLTSCGWHTHYMQNIKQGDIISEALVKNLSPGMTKSQVINQLGSPVLTPIHLQRWEYVYYRKKKAKITKHRRLVLYFEQDTLKRIVTS